MMTVAEVLTVFAGVSLMTMGLGQIAVYFDAKRAMREAKRENARRVIERLQLLRLEGGQ
jgi:hypothetical protein